MATLKQVFDARDLSDSEKLASLELLLFPADDPPVLSDEILRGMKEDADLIGDDGAQFRSFLSSEAAIADASHLSFLLLAFFAAVILHFHALIVLFVVRFD